MRFLSPPNPIARPGYCRRTHRLPAPFSLPRRCCRDISSRLLRLRRINSVSPNDSTGRAERFRRRQLRLATLIERSKCVRLALHLAGIARKPENFHWHWRCITREFHERKS